MSMKSKKRPRLAGLPAGVPYVISRNLAVPAFHTVQAFIAKAIQAFEEQEGRKFEEAKVHVRERRQAPSRCR